ncbi:MAG: hypothetical protein M3Q97_07315 [Bacteroidota bacterium]|nr:hypothetical protein [Bacteroidota bacterium]
MNRIIQINIQGVLFMVDEAAYDVLRQYLDALKKQFGTSADSREILDDIELRIVEMLNDKKRGQKEVILPTDVEEIIRILGRPEEISGHES